MKNQIRPAASAKRIALAAETAAYPSGDHPNAAHRQTKHFGQRAMELMGRSRRNRFIV